MFTEISGANVNRGALYGWKSHVSPFIYGPNIYADKMKQLVESLLADRHHNLCMTLLNDNWHGSC